MKKYILVGLSDYTAKLLTLIPPDDIAFIMDKNNAGKEVRYEIDGVVYSKNIYANINPDDLPQILEMFEFVMVNYGQADIDLLRQNHIPFIFSPVLLLRYGVKDLNLYPYPIPYLMNTYGKSEMTPLTEGELAEFKVWEQKYRRIIIGVVHPTAIGNFCWTYGRFCEYACMNKREDVFIGICKGWHPCMLNKKLENGVPNQYLWKKMLEEYPGVNASNVNFICGYICHNLDQLDIFDYTSTVELSTKAHHLFMENDEFRQVRFSPINRISFTAMEQEEGAKLAYDMGIWYPYVCFFARDNAYMRQLLRTTTSQNLEANYNIRYADINSFSLMAENLRKLGIQSVRMGAVVEKEYSGVGIDYSSVGRSEFMDAYLFANCKFCVMFDSGINFIPVGLFSKPQIFIAPIVYAVYIADGFFLPDLIIYCMAYSTEKKRFLRLREVLDIAKSLNFYVHNYMPYLLEHGIHGVQPTAQDIWDVTEEMVNIQNGTQEYTSEDIELQKKFRSIVSEYTKDRQDVVGSIGRVGSAWLRKNQWFLE